MKSSGRLLVRRFWVLAVTRVLRFWKIFFSPFIGNNCRFYPSCSEYFADSLCCHGPVVGSWIGLKRICRCSSLSSGGFDPVPGLQKAESKISYLEQSRRD